MANMMDYLDWRGDLTFHQAPFNQVDNLILANISYVELEDFMDGPMAPNQITIREAADRYFALHTEEELLARTTTTRLAPFLLKKAAESARFQDIPISNFVNETDFDQDSQFAAMTFQLPDKTDYVAFRGTDDTIVGWKEDFNFAVSYGTPGQCRAVEYLDDHFPRSFRKLRVGGHSKGGNFAVYASVFCKEKVQDKICCIYSNDGPGFRESLTGTEEYQKMLPKIVSIVPQSSIIGMLLVNEFSHSIVKSTGTGIYQHDAMTWEVLGTRFVEAEELSESSTLIDRALSQWIAGIGDQERQEFIDMLFSSMEAGGKTTFQEFSAQGFKSLADMAKSIASQPIDRQLTFGHVLTNLAKSGKDVIFEELQSGITNKRK